MITEQVENVYGEEFLASMPGEHHPKLRSHEELICDNCGVDGQECDQLQIGSLFNLGVKEGI